MAQQTLRPSGGANIEHTQAYLYESFRSQKISFVTAPKKIREKEKCKSYPTHFAHQPGLFLGQNPFFRFDGDSLFAG